MSTPSAGSATERRTDAPDRTAPAPGSADLARASGSVDLNTLGYDAVTRHFAGLANPDLNEKELKMLLFEALRLGLDPASGKQIYGVIYNKNDPRKRKMSIQIAIDGLRSIAARTGKMDGSAMVEDGPDVDSDGVKHPAFCVATVWRAGCSHPFVAKVRWEERRRFERYDYQGNRYPEGKAPLTDFWRDQPYGQLEKCAEAAALRKAFPMELRGASLVADQDDEDPEDERHRDAPVAEGRVVTPPAPPPQAPAAAAPHVEPPANGSDVKPGVYTTLIQDLMDDPAVKEDDRLRQKANDLINMRLDAMHLDHLRNAKPEHTLGLKALYEDLQQTVKA
jgi:phage recombination protein Bet